MNYSPFPPGRHLALIAGGLLWSSVSVGTVDSWTIPGEHGELQVYGSLAEGTCLLDMRSEFQDVNMDSSALTKLLHPGDTGQPVRIIFHVLGCFAARMAGKDMPMVSFQSAADPDEPTLLKIKGVTGVGLRILDAQGRQILPGQRHRPKFSNDGGNTLVYQAIPVRTIAPLTTGEFKASVDFRMNYE